MPFNRLIGRTISGLSISDDDTVLVFYTDQGPVAIHAEGDCCSFSWFHEILGTLSHLIGQTVTSVETRDLPCPDSYADHDSLADYGVMLTTPKGRVDIVYRNDSNGYYGGYAKRYYGDLSQLTLTAIGTDDWRSDQ